MILGSQGEPFLRAGTDATYGLESPDEGDRFVDGRNAFLRYNGAAAPSRRKIFISFIILTTLLESVANLLGFGSRPGKRLDQRILHRGGIVMTQ